MRETYGSYSSVGVKKLDEQHKQIINMINFLLLNSEMDVLSDEISELLNKMTEYANNHFKTEEELLKKYNYHKLSSQKNEHETYCLTVVNLCQDTMKYDTKVPKKILKYLVKWWTNHILNSDMEYKMFLTKRGFV